MKKYLIMDEQTENLLIDVLDHVRSQDEDLQDNFDAIQIDRADEILNGINGKHIAYIADTLPDVPTVAELKGELLKAVRKEKLDVAFDLLDEVADYVENLIMQHIRHLDTSVKTAKDIKQKFDQKYRKTPVRKSPRKPAKKPAKS